MFKNGVYITARMCSIVILTNVQYYQEAVTNKDFWIVTYEYGGRKYKKTLLSPKNLSELIHIGYL
jgi:hypothetical protein